MDVRSKFGRSTSVFAIVLTYAFLASLWILSDRATALLVSDAEMLSGSAWRRAGSLSRRPALLYILVRRLRTN